MKGPKYVRKDRRAGRKSYALSDFDHCLYRYKAMKKTRYRRILSILISFVMTTSFSGQVLAESGFSNAFLPENDDELLSLVGSDEEDLSLAGDAQLQISV